MTDFPISGSMRLIIDSDGSVCSAYDDKLLDRWGYPDPDFDLPSFAVRNLGAIDVQVDPGQTNVTFRWLTVKPDALDSLIELLGRLPSRPVLVCAEAETWVETPFTTTHEAAEWIGAHRSLARASKSSNVITTPRHIRALGERPLSRIDEDEDRLALIFKKWRLSRGKFDGDTASFLVRFGLFDRTVVASESHNDGALIFEHSGAAFTLYDKFDKAWNLQAPGARLIDQPDPEYGRWIDRTYREILDRGEPCFESVDALIQARAAEPNHSCYDRIVLPWCSTEGTRIVTGTSYQTRTISVGAQQ